MTIRTQILSGLLKGRGSPDLYPFTSNSNDVPLKTNLTEKTEAGIQGPEARI
jgi:hypothetical protein